MSDGEKSGAIPGSTRVSWSPDLRSESEAMTVIGNVVRASIERPVRREDTADRAAERLDRKQLGSLVAFACRCVRSGVTRDEWLALASSVWQTAERHETGDLAARDDNEASRGNGGCT